MELDINQVTFVCKQRAPMVKSYKLYENLPAHAHPKTSASAPSRSPQTQGGRTVSASSRCVTGSSRTGIESTQGHGSGMGVGTPSSVYRGRGEAGGRSLYGGGSHPGQETTFTSLGETWKMTELDIETETDTNDWNRDQACSTASLDNEDLETMKGVTSIKKKTIEHDLNKVYDAVTKLSLDPNKTVDHKSELIDAAKLLDEVREPELMKDFNFDELKVSVSECEDLSSLCQILWHNLEARNCLLEIQNSAYLEEMIHIGRSYISSPLKTFPPSINQNVYAEIIKFSLVHCRNTVLFLLNLTVKKDQHITPQAVVRIAIFLSSLAHSVNRDNNALAKLKSVLMHKEGLTDEGMDAFLVAGISESSRSQRRVTEFLASISPQVLKSAAKLYPHVRTMDNLDIRIGGLTHHLTQEFIQGVS